MRRWVVKANVKGLDALVLEHSSVPEPGPGEVRIRVHAAALNARDQFVLNGEEERLLSRDIIPLADGAGVIDAVGSGVQGWSPGDRVTGLYLRDWFQGPPHANIGHGLGAREQDGMLAEYVVLPAKRIARLPASLSFAEGATLTVAAVTAWNALYGKNPISHKSKVLVLGTGGVALFALLFARAAGAEVVMTTSHESKFPRLRALGANAVVNYKHDPNWGRTIFEMTGGVDKVVELGGTGTLTQSLAAVGFGGEVALSGFKTVGPLDSRAMMWRGSSIRGVGTGNAEHYHDLARAIDIHRIRPPIDRRFNFEDTKSAYRAQTSPDIFGKIVIEVVEDPGDEGQAATAVPNG